MKRPNGFIAWHGASLLDGAPIALIITGCKGSSKNPKTGGMLQSWIIRTDIDPLDAVNTGQDSSICGDCKHRGTVKLVNGKLKVVKRACYVRVFQAPKAVYKAYHRGNYAALLNMEFPSMVSGRNLRVGSYGDPAAIPAEVWRMLILATGNAPTTGYTHAWKYCSTEYAEFCMASADTPAEYRAAKKLGYRVFRVRAEGQPKLKGEAICPASKEMNHATTCEDCLACCGTKGARRSDIVIFAHSNGSVHFKGAAA